jgi:tetratricopeptide (TPR) repeat protein
MSAQFHVARQSLGRTFMVAAVVLGAIGAVQVGAVGWKLFHKEPPSVAGQEEGPRRPPERIDVQKLLSEMPPPEEPAALTVGNDPLQDPVTVGPTGLHPVPIATPLEPRASAEPKSDAPAVAVARPLIQPRPTPVPLSALTPKVSPQFTELVEQGKLLRNTGDTAGALVKFREASALDPANAQAFAEQAYTYEKMSLYDKAAEQWKKVLSLGESGGVLYSAAKSKLDMAMAETMRVVGPSGAARPIGEGKLIGLGTPVIQNEPDPASAKRFLLRVPILARSGQKISVKDMKVFVLFYDRLNGSDLASTAANVSNRWGDPPADWSDGDMETLEVTYDLPPLEGRGERREYYGYIVRLYYQDKLQDSYAEPAALNQRFPAALTLSE